MNSTGRDKINARRPVLTVAALQSVGVAVALLAFMSPGWSESKPIRPAAPGPGQSQPPAPNATQPKPAAGSVHVTTTPLQMTGWDASTSKKVQLTTGQLQMTGWDASTLQNVQLTTGQLQMTGSTQ